MKETLYLETTIPRYLTANVSRDVVVPAHQQITHEWWQSAEERYDIHVSELVVTETSRGDPEAASKRLAIVQRFPVLKIEPEAENLAAV